MQYIPVSERLKKPTTKLYTPVAERTTGLVGAKSVLEFTEKEKQTELKKYMGKVVSGLKTKALIKEQSIVPTEPIVIPPRDDKPKGFFGKVGGSAVEGLKTIGKPFVDIPKSFIKEVAIPSFEETGRLLEKIKKGYQPTGDVLFENLDTKKKVKAFTKEYVKEIAQTPQDFTMGLMSSISGGLGFLERFGWDTAKPIADKLDDWSRQIAPEKLNIANMLVSGAGSMASFYIPGMGVTKGIKVLTGISPKIANLFGNSAMTFLESAMEAGGVYRENIQQGNSVKEAKRNSDIDFGINVLLLGLTNRFNFTGNNQISLVKAIKQRLLTGGREAIQEYGQQIAGNITTYKKWNEGVKEAGVVGGLLGFMFGGGVNPNININIQTQKEILDLVDEAKKSEAGFAKIPDKPKLKIKPITKAIPDELAPLVKEARKYKSAEEFSKSFTYERGGHIKSFAGEAGEGIYAYPAKNQAMRSYYTKSGETLQSIKPHSDAKIIDLTKPEIKNEIIALGKKDGIKGINNSNYYQEVWTIKKYLYNKNYDAYLTPHKGAGIPTGKQLIITNENKFDIIPKSQLTDIYNQATKAVKEAKPITKAISDDIFYHSTSKQAAEQIKKAGFEARVGDRSLGATKGKGVFLYKEDLAAAKIFSTNFKDPAIIETKIKGKIFKAMADKYPSIRSLAEDTNLINKLKKQGFVGIEGDEMGQAITFIFDTKSIKPIATKAIKEVKQPIPIDLKKKWGTPEAKEEFRKMAKEFPEPEQRAGVKDILKGIEKKEITVVEKEIMETAFKDIQREQNFYGELESQYQQFKELRLRKLNEIEDASQLKAIRKAKPEQIDNILYHQEKTADEVFDMFKERLMTEREAGKGGMTLAEWKIELKKKREKTVRKKIKEAQVRGELIGFEAGIEEKISRKGLVRKETMEKAVAEVKSPKEILDRRRAMVKTVRDYFNLTDAELRQITRKDIRLMSNIEFKKFIDDIRIKAEKTFKLRQEKTEMIAAGYKPTAKLVKIEEVPKKVLSGFDNFIDLNKIKTKNIPYKEMNIAEIVRGDKMFPAIRRSGFFAIKEMQTANIRDIYEQKLSPHLMALKQDGYKLEKKFGIIFSKVWKPTEKTIRAEKEFNIKNVKIIKELGEKHKIKATKKNLKHLSDVIENKVKATNNETAYIKELRTILDDLRKQANTVREIMGKDKIGYIENYIPHIQKTTLWNELLSNEATISDNLDFIIPNQTKNPFSYKRMKELMPKSERNLYILLDRYVGAIGKDIYITPAIENIKAYNGVIKNREKIQAGKYWDEYIRTGLIGKQHKLDTALSIGQKGRKVLVKWNNMVNLAFLTGKVAWNIATQPLSYIMNVPMEAGVKNSITAIYKSFNSGLRQYVKENSNVLNIKSTDVRAVAIGEGRNIQNRIYRTKIDKYNDFISMLGSIEERELTLASYVAGLDRAKNLGYKGEDALWFADLTAARTQSMYNKENRALILNSDIARTMFPFQSFSVEMFNHLKEISTKAGGAMQLTYRQRFGKLFGLLIGLFLANWYSEELTGRKKTTIGTFFPFIGSYIDILAAKALGKGYYGGRSPITVMQIGEDIIRGSRDYLKHGSFKRLRKVGVNFGLALGGIGGGGQINNLIDGIMADINEDVRNIEGDVMFNVNDTISKVKAPIFGVWAAKEGIEYWLPKEKKEPSPTAPKLKIKPIKIKPLKLKIKPIKLR